VLFVGRGPNHQRAASASSSQRNSARPVFNAATAADQWHSHPLAFDAASAQWLAHPPTFCAAPDEDASVGIEIPGAVATHKTGSAGFPGLPARVEI
jgi:hypothetical protein